MWSGDSVNFLNVETYLIYGLGCVGLEVIDEIEDAATGNVCNIRVVVKITLELLTMSISITWHTTYLNQIIE